MSPSARLVLGTFVFALAVVVVAGARSQEGGGSPAALPTAGAAASTLVEGSPPPSGAPFAVGSASSPSPSASPAGAGDGQSVAQLIAGLPVAAEHREGYARNLFRLWIDADGDGCDTRQEVLIADAVVAPAVGAGCKLSGGAWISPYDGLRFTDPSKLDIDHVVPLAEAWDSGAYEWMPDRRTSFGNDLGVPWALLAVSASSNRSKGDRDPAEWMPPLASDRCEYVIDWIAVKVRWQLAIDEAEREALLELSSSCDLTSVPAIPTP